jgi:hypothetical protein
MDHEESFNRNEVAWLPLSPEPEPPSPEPPSGCSAIPQSIQFTITDNHDSAFIQIETSLGYVSISINGQEPTVHGEGVGSIDIFDLPTGTYCMFPCNQDGEAAGNYHSWHLIGADIQDLYVHEPLQGVTIFHITEGAYTQDTFVVPSFDGAPDLLFLLSDVITVDASAMGANIGSLEIQQQVPTCTSVILPAINAIWSLRCMGLAMPEAAVDYCINQLDPNVRGATPTPNNQVVITGGTSAAPGAASTATRSAMTSHGYWTQTYNP